MTHETPPEPPPDLPDRLHQVETLHLQGWTHRQIAAHLHISPKTVFRDLKRVEADRLDRLTRKVAAERVHSIAVYRHTQAVLWKVIDTLMANEDHKSVASAARAVVDAEKAVNATLDDLAKRSPPAAPPPSATASRNSPTKSSTPPTPPIPPLPTMTSPPRYDRRHRAARRAPFRSC